MTMKNISRYFFIGVLLILAPGFFPAYSIARDAAPEDVIAGLPLLEGDSLVGKQYLIQLSGTVMNETFSSAQGLLRIMGPLTKSKYNNPYLIVIEGYPKQNSVNCFYWESSDSEMSALMNEITCDIKQSFVKKTRQNFYFLSPSLLKRTGDQEVSLVKEANAKKEAEKVALPTSINSRAGKLKLRIYSNSISGSVWMKGYDPVEKSFVLYSARLYGKKAYGLKPKLEGKKLTEVRE
jgi:hypothetical protein